MASAATVARRLANVFRPHAFRVMSCSFRFFALQSAPSVYRGGSWLEALGGSR